MKAKETDIRLLIVPQSNEAEARAVDDIAVIGLGSLTDAVDFFRNGCLPDTPAAPARRTKMPMALPATLTRFASSDTFMVTSVLPIVR